MSKFTLKNVFIILCFITLCIFMKPSNAVSITRAEVEEYFHNLQESDPAGKYWMNEIMDRGKIGIEIRRQPLLTVLHRKLSYTQWVPCSDVYGPGYSENCHDAQVDDFFSFKYCDGTDRIEWHWSNHWMAFGEKDGGLESEFWFCCVHGVPWTHVCDWIYPSPSPSQTEGEAGAACAQGCQTGELLIYFWPIEDCSNACCATNDSVGSSANYASGNLYDTRDIIPPIGTKLPISFSLAYNSLDLDEGPLSRGWTHNYNMRLKIKSVNDPYLLLIGDSGGRTFYLNDGSGIYHPLQSSGDHSTIVFDSANEQYLLTRKDGTIYIFDARYGKLRSITDRNNNTVTLGFTTFYFIGAAPAGYLTSITDSMGRPISLTYDSQGRLITITDPALRATHIGYDTTGNLVSIIDPAGDAWQYTYDSRRKILSKTDPMGNVTTYAYDGQSRIVSATTPAGTKTITYGTDSTATITERDGSVWAYKYGTYPTVPLEVTGPNNARTTSVYDYNKNLISRTDPKGNTTSYTYDSDGNMLTMTDALNNTTTYTYNQWGEVTSITDPVGNLTNYIYDANGNLISVTDPSGAVTQYQHDARGNITAVTTPAGQVTTMAYDQYGNPASVTDPTGAVSTFAYDLSGNMTGQSDALGNMTTFEYNVLNQLVNVTDQQGHATAYTYDANGNRVAVTDAKGNVSTYEYSYNSQPITVTDAIGSVTTYTYGGAGCQSCGGGTDKLTSVIDANNHIIGYEYDTSGRLARMTDQLGNIETYTYDLNGNLLTLTDRKGQTTSYTYDSLNRMTQATYADGSYTTYAYDATGKVTTITDSVSGTISYTYSTAISGGPVGRVINETTPSGSISYSYDMVGRRTSLTVAGQPTVNYGYDTDNRLTGINTLINGVAAGFSLSYDVLGRRVEIILPNGVTTNYTYDNLSRLQNLAHLNPVNQVLESLTYTYDATGNRTSADRLAGTLLKPNPVSATSYNEANRMLTFNDKNIAYDANGNMISVINSCGTTTYMWDVRNRLVGISGYKPDCSPLTASFKYDALGRRIEKTINGKTIEYLYDGKDIVQEIENAVPSVNYICTLSIDEPLARIQSNGTVRYYQMDALGSIVGLTDETGAIRTQYTYDAFGKVTISGESSDDPLQYTGRENDGTGLYYYRARYYNPDLQRFISEDPIGFEGGDGNFYVYVQNNPLNLSDPEGKEVRLCQRALGTRVTPKRFGPFHHAYLNVNGVIYGFHPESNRLYDKGKVEIESPGKDIKCGNPLKCVDDSCVLKKIAETTSAPGNYSFGFYDCRAWAKMIILLCHKEDCCE